MNDKCAAGTGRFLAGAAEALDLALDEIGPLSLEATAPVRLSTVCAVFVESDIMSYLAQGKSVEDILGGVHERDRRPHHRPGPPGGRSRTRSRSRAASPATSAWSGPSRRRPAGGPQRQPGRPLHGGDRSRPLRSRAGRGRGRRRRPGRRELSHGGRRYRPRLRHHEVRARRRRADACAGTGPRPDQARLREGRPGGPRCGAGGRGRPPRRSPTWRPPASAATRPLSRHPDHRPHLRGAGSGDPVSRHALRPRHRAPRARARSDSATAARSRSST